jgi:hypothetical protein
MKFDELYKFIGYGVVSIFLFYIAARSIRFQLSVVESLVGINKKPKTTTTDDTSENEVEEE